MGGRPGLLVVVPDPVLEGRLAALAGDGYRVARVDSTAGALRHLDQGGIDVVVLDVGIEGFAGIKLAARLREERPGLRLLLLGSTRSTEEATATLLRRVADHYMDRPLDEDEVARLLRGWAARGAGGEARPATRQGPGTDQ